MTKGQRLDVAIIGIGRMGANHVRVLTELEDFNVVALCDTDIDRASVIAKRNQIPHVYEKCDKLINREHLDAVVIAAPSSFHTEIALKTIEAGISTFIEKPMAPTVEECELILSNAKEHDVGILIGHIERYNTVVALMRRLLDEGLIGEVHYLETVRSGPFPKRLYGSQDGVVLDLAVHDLDLVSFFFSGLSKLYAQHITISPEGRHQDIYAKAMFRTRDGVVGNSEFSWISPRTERTITIFGDKGMLFGNLREQELWFYENGDVSSDISDDYYKNVLMGRMSEGQVIKFSLKKEEPLKLEHCAFSQMIRNGRFQDAGYGMHAVRYALALIESARKDKVIYFDRSESIAGE